MGVLMFPPPAQPRYRRLVGGTLAPQVPWQAMIFHSDNVLDGGYAAGALISDRWVLTAGRNLFIRKSREDARRQDLVIPKVYVGITERVEAVAANERAVEQVKTFAHVCVFHFTDKV